MEKVFGLDVGLANDELKSEREEAKRWNEAHSQLLPFEQELVQKKTVLGNQTLDEQYPRIDLSPVSDLLVRQDGVPFPVPKFAVLDAYASAPFVVCGLSQGRWGYRNSPHGRLWYEKCRQHVESHRNREAWKRAVIFGLLGVAGTMLAAWLLSLGSIPLVAAHAFPGIPEYVLSGLVGLTMLVIGALQGMEKSYQITANFPGIVPDHIREKVVQSRGEFSSLGFVYAPSWKYEKTNAALIDPDPLLVGCKNDVWYLISKFDVTPPENWLAKEFTEAKKKAQ